jgi:hypothetical protein
MYLWLSIELHHAGIECRTHLSEMFTGGDSVRVSSSYLGEAVRVRSDFAGEGRATQSGFEEFFHSGQDFWGALGL